MNISIGKELDTYVRLKVGSGEYASASEVLREGLRLLKEKDRMLEARLEGLKTEIQVGLEQAEAGELLDGPEVMKQLRAFLDKKATLRADGEGVHTHSSGKRGSTKNP